MNIDLFSFEAVLYDVINCLVCFIVVFFLLKKTDLPMKYRLVILVLVASPFLFNGMLITSTYMPDQFRYLNLVRHIRVGEITGLGSYDGSNTVLFSSYFLSILPIPFIDNIRSIGIGNKILYLAVLIYFYRKDMLNNTSMLFLLLYPSAVLYSGLALRDTLVLTFMMFSFYFMTIGRVISALLWVAPLLFIKFQNFFIQLLFLVVYIGFRVEIRGLNWKQTSLMIIIFFAFLLLFSSELIPLLNKYRLAMWVEDGGHITDIEVIQGTFDLMFRGITAAPYFLLKPFPWEARNILQLVQSFENIVVTLFILKLGLSCLRLNRRITTFWLIYLYGSFSIYGLVVANFGTAARYKYTFLIVFVVFLTYDVFLKGRQKRERLYSVIDSKTVGFKSR